MEIIQEAILLTAESKPYDFNGNAGTSHKIRLNIGGEIYVCKSSAEQISALQKFEGRTGDATVKVNSRKENLSLELVSFDAE